MSGAPAVRLAGRLRRVRPSATLAVGARAKALRGQGIDVLDLAAGEPDFDTPAHILAAAKDALDRGATRYTAAGGTPELRAAAAAWLSAAHGLRLAAEDVVVCSGAKHSLYNLFQVLLDDGDEVIVPAPCWLSYPDMVALAGGHAVTVPGRAEDGFLPPPDAIARALTPRTRAIVVNSPGNPTGAVWSDAALAPIARLCAGRGLWIVSDDIYRTLVYGVAPGHVTRHGEDVRARTILVDGVSKAYAMTGFRIGFLAGPREIVRAIDTVQSQSTSNPAAVSQAAALAALTGPQDSVETMRRAFDERRRRLVAGLRAVPGARVPEPHGAFYVLADLSACAATRGRDDAALALHLLEHHHVATVPGSPFGAPGCLRLSYACSMDTIDRALARLAPALAAAD